MTLVLTPGQRHEAVAFDPLMASGAVKRRGPGRPNRRPGRVAGDQASSSRKSRQYLRRHGSRITIPRQQHECRTGPCDRAISRLRERVERLINRLKQHRRLATRYEKCAANSRAMWLIAATLLWL
jgi:transposase